MERKIPESQQRTARLSKQPQNPVLQVGDEGQDALIFDVLRDSLLGKRSRDMSDLYWLADAQMAKLSIVFLKSHGKPRVDDRRVLSGIIHVNRNGLRWRDAPDAYDIINSWQGKLERACRTVTDHLRREHGNCRSLG